MDSEDEVGGFWQRWSWRLVTKRKLLLVKQLITILNVI